MKDVKLKPEVFKQKTPCLDCPFRKDGGARHGAGMAASYASYFLTFPGATFPCHKSVPPTDDRTAWSPWQDGQVLCAGGLLLAAKSGVKNGVVHYGERAGFYNQATAHAPEDLALVYDSAAAMVADADGDDN